MRLLAAAILNCYFIICCKGVSVTLGITQSTYVENGTSLLMECLLTSGNIDLSTARGWLKDGVSLISDGISTGSGSGYTETVTAGTKAFSLYTPPMDFSFDGSVFQCEYGFLQATLNIMISEFGSTDQSKEDCIDGKSIEKCWFSLSKVYPGVESQNLTVTYKDDTVENITSMLNRTSQLNTDGKTLAFFFRIESSNSGMSISKDVKAVKLSFIAGPVSRTLTIMIKGLTTLSSAISSDMSTNSEPLSTISSDMSTTVSEVSSHPVTTSSAGISQEIVITITISSSILGLGVLILLIVLVVKQYRQKNRQTPAKNKGNCFATKQGNFSKKDALKSSIKPRKSKFSGKRNTKQESISLDKFVHTQFNDSQAPKNRMYEHYPQTTDYMYWNNNGNHNVFNHSHAERNMFKYGNQHDRYPKSHSGPNNRIGYQSPYPEHPGHNEKMFQFYRADKLYQGQQMYQGPYVAQYDHHIKIKPENKRRYEGRTYERNWDFLY